MNNLPSPPCRIVPITDPCACSTNTNNSAISPPAHNKPFPNSVVIDPDSSIPPHMRNQFRVLNLEFHGVFNPSISKYNGASGKIEAFVNMGPTLPPQWKGRLPQYNRAPWRCYRLRSMSLRPLECLPNPNRLHNTVTTTTYTTRSTTTYATS